MQFLNTIWLWGLVGFIVPIGIHLLSRKTGKVIRFGNIRHLTDTDSRQFKSLRLNELVLLALRCVMIALLVFFIAKLHFTSLEKKSRWLLIDKGLEGDPDFALLTDSLRTNGFEIRSLSAGFPFLRDSASSNQNFDYWGLLEKIQAQPLERVVVVANNYLKGFKGKRPKLPDHIQWLSKDPGSKEFVLNAIKEANDSIAVRIGKSNAHKTFFHSRTGWQGDASLSLPLNSVTVETTDTLTVAVVYDPAYIYDKDILIAAINAVGRKTHVMPRIEAIPSDRYSIGTKSKWVFWLSQKRAPGISQNLIEIDIEGSGGEDLIVPIGGGKKWGLTKRLNEEVAFKENLAVELALLLVQTDKYKARVDALDRRTLPEELRWSKDSDDHLNVQAVMNTKSGERIIVITLLVILLAERLLAFRRNQ